jgi:hypothetical protein
MISPRDFLSAVGRFLLSAIVAATLAFAVQLLYGQSLSPLLRLILGGGTLLLLYLWMLLYVMGQKAFYLDLFRGLWQRYSVGEKATATMWSDQISICLG